MYFYELYILTAISLQIVLKRRDSGYGFTLGGWNPVKVATVEDGKSVLPSGENNK